MIELQKLSWSHTDLPRGFQHLAQSAGLHPAEITTLEPPSTAEEDVVSQWMEYASAKLEISIQEISWTYREYEKLLQLAAPALLRLDNTENSRFLLLIRRGRRRVTLLKSDQTTQNISIQALSDYLREQEAGSLGTEVDQLLAHIPLPQENVALARHALLTEQLNSKQLAGCWLLQLPPYSPLRRQLKQARITSRLSLIFGLAIVQQLITLIVWYFIGQGALRNNFSSNLIAVWILVLLTTVPVTLLGLWAQATLSIKSGTLFRSRMLTGILNLDPSSIRHQGSGQFLERVIKTESFQALLLGGGLTALLATVQLAVAALVLSLGVGGILHGLVLVAWALFVLFTIYFYTRAHRRWSDAYRQLTTDLVERMVGHRTRLAQELRTMRHVDEDAQLEHYLLLTQQVDRWQLVLNAVVNRGWLVVGLGAVIIPFLSQTPDITKLAISIGGIILAGNGLLAITNGVMSLVNAQSAWQDVEPLLTAAAHPPSVGSRLVDSGSSGQDRKGALLVARDVMFRFRPNAKPALNGINLQIEHGERLLLEGVSGSGKSTLAHVLKGTHLPESGLLLLNGFDQETLGQDNWRQRVIGAPQFHENHILTETFAFNLLMGKRWPATDADLHEATTICHELGLGDLLARMPSGLQQMLGEGGWQLSHGERSRLFIARALLQQADLTILDESFAALDPINLRRAINCVHGRASTLLVIAHP